jgi:hypothetical protein
MTHGQIVTVGYQEEEVPISVRYIDVIAMFLRAGSSPADCQYFEREEK